MSDWIHCNRCSLRHSSNVKFCLTECGHIFCSRCATTIRETKNCMYCNKSCTVLQLSKDVDPNILEYFTPLETVLGKSLEIYRFQLNHRNILFQTLLKKYNYTKKENITYSHANKKLIAENKMLKSMLRSTGQGIYPLITSTPVSQISSNGRFQYYQQNSTTNSSTLPTPNNTYQHDMQQQKTPTMYPGFAKRTIPQSLFGSASSSSHEPSPAQLVPMPGNHGRISVPPIHYQRPQKGTMYSLDELRRVTNTNKSN